MSLGFFLLICKTGRESQKAIQVLTHLNSADRDIQSFVIALSSLYQVFHIFFLYPVDNQKGEIKMKTKILTLMILVTTLLLAACSSERLKRLRHPSLSLKNRW